MRKDLEMALAKLEGYERTAAVIERQELTYNVELLSDEDIEQELGLQRGALGSMNRFEENS